MLLGGHVVGSIGGDLVQLDWCGNEVKRHPGLSNHHDHQKEPSQVELVEVLPALSLEQFFPVPGQLPDRVVHNPLAGTNVQGVLHVRIVALEDKHLSAKRARLLTRGEVAARVAFLLVVMVHARIPLLHDLAMPVQLRQLAAPCKEVLDRTADDVSLGPYLALNLPFDGSNWY